MPTRIDYLDDPDAPAANSLVPAVNVIVADDRGRILFVKRTDNNRYALPGGTMELGESITDAAIRETREETGLGVEITGLVGIYTNPRHLIEYTSNGEVRQEFAVALTAQAVDGVPRISSEASEVLWVAADELDRLDMHPAQRLRVDHYLAQSGWPHVQ